MELISLAVLASSVGVSAYVGSHAERLVHVVEQQLRPSKDTEQRLVVPPVSGDNRKEFLADMHLD